ncbi:autoimmune regulator [Vigna unguiculata]|uniref:Autoimmune regulator n=1 Tax=Vigna unguiculata TaxID=3917 RepID=A0A4D6N0P0_VIGUN|nr:autoimmune regulator [Vigna unguiculata]
MREGLRSRARLGTVSGGEEVVHKKKVVVKSEAVDKGGEGLEVQNSTIEKKGEVALDVKEECGFDLNVSASGEVDLEENESGKGCFSGGGDTVVVEVDKKAKKEQGSNNEVLVGGRVLRSRSKGVKDRRVYYGESEDAVSESDRECSGVETVKVKTECEEAGEFLADSYENEKAKVKKAENGTGNLKRKRGRPPKIKLKVEDQPVHQSPRKRGRPPLASKQNHVVVHNRKEKVVLRKDKKSLTMRRDANVNAIDDADSRKSAGVELEKKEVSSVKKSKFTKALETGNNVVASPVRSNTDNALVSEKSGRNRVKQLVRDQIKEILSAAGWTVDYRPRNGREYHDAVYVSLDGHTHWSITLAYKRLKEYYEAGNGEGKAYGPGFKFTPIAAEDFQILTKVIKKQRQGKVKSVKKGGKGGNKNKGRSGSGAAVGKSVKRKMKRKRSPGDTDSISPNRMPVLVRDHKRHKTQHKLRSGPLVRNAKEIDSETEGYVLYSGKRTLFAWMIDLGTVLLNAKVHYKAPEDKSAALDGKITGDGIHCGCCDKVITISEFEVHAGRKFGDPLQNIYVEEGKSLLQCLLDSWNKQDESERHGFHFVDVAGEDPNDDTCGVCGDGGDLICCDGCPSTFHQDCLDIQKFPSGDWHCIYCCCKFCGSVNGCSDQKDSDDDLTVSKLLTCRLCEQKYHRSCIEANDCNTIDYNDVIFCGNRCQELSERLEMLLGVRHEIEDGYSWTFIRRSDVGIDDSQKKPQMVECNSKLAVALSIMDECFMPYIDHRSGVNLIHSILYNRGSNFNRLNYSGFVTAILERGDEMICAASIRIHGNQLAEMPFIGTRYMYRRQGMCRRLLNAIELGLSSLNVELLVIPAISELRETWTSVFGFEPLESTIKQTVHNTNLLVFPHVDMLQKKISKHDMASHNPIPSEAVNQIAYNCNGAGSSGSDLINYIEIPPCPNTCQINDEATSNESDCHLPEGSVNNVPDVASNINGCRQSTKDDTCEVVCHTGDENPVMDNTKKNVCEDVTDTSGVAGDGQLNTTSCINTEATKVQCVNVSLEVTENLPNHVAVSNEVLSNNKSAEDSEPCGTESITRDSKLSADSIHQDSSIVSDSCKLRSDTDCGQQNIIGTEEKRGEFISVCGSNGRPNGDCASGEGTAATNELLHLPSQDMTNKKPWVKGSSDLPEPDLQVDQTEENSAPSPWSPNTASGCASTGSASRGSTEGIFLSNQAS